jgi:hypothetical protein
MALLAQMVNAFLVSVPLFLIASVNVVMLLRMLLPMEPSALLVFARMVVALLLRLAALLVLAVMKLMVMFVPRASLAVLLNAKFLLFALVLAMNALKLFLLKMVPIVMAVFVCLVFVLSNTILNLKNLCALLVNAVI